MHYEFKLTDSLETIFPEQGPKRSLGREISGLGGEILSLQMAYRAEMDEDGLEVEDLRVDIRCESPVEISMRRTELVPATMPAYGGQTDDHYLFTGPRLCPDVLLPMGDGSITPYIGQWRSIWLDFTLARELCGQRIPFVVEVRCGQEVLWSRAMELRVINQALPDQELIYTEWFHGDCLADYYGVEVFSEAHWAIMEKFIRGAARRGVNMMLTPVFTPPLDTVEGGERTTIQLVGVKKEGVGYTFDFSRLRRFISICRNNGIKYLEISHLFTQWGAKHAPKIMAEVNSRLERIFGWETDASGKAYTYFLTAFLPELKLVLEEEGMLEFSYFHISDEPGEDALNHYRMAKGMVERLVDGRPIMDALSSLKFYELGVVKQPIVASSHIEPFLEAGVPNLWTYYCCAQNLEVSNHFMSMASQRNRILGVQLYLYDIRGFLHWGYNFYNSHHSLRTINPYLVTDAGGAFPSGDSFLVYPGEDGEAYDSIRFMVLAEALYDLRALRKLEELAGRDYVEELIHHGLKERITFKTYPREAEYLIRLREEVNQQIEKRC